MELKIIERDENRIRMEIRGEDHTFLNVLNSVLLEDDEVVFTTYEIKHPRISDSVLFVRTKKEDPITVLHRAASILSGRCKEFKESWRECQKGKT
jgi:DNA-directed RNA polymerase subunit L